MTSLLRSPLLSLVAFALSASAAAAQASAVQIGPSVYLTGSSEADDLWLRGADGLLQIQGLNGSTVNGQTVVTFQGVFSSVYVSTGAGDDIVRMTDSRRSRSVFVSTGAGADLVYAERNVIAGELRVDVGAPGAWEDFVVLSGQGAQGNAVLGSLVVQGEHATVLAHDCDVGGDLGVFTGAGADYVALDNMSVQGDVVVHTGSGADQVRVAGQDNSVGNLLYGRLRIDTARGTDTVQIGSALGGPSDLRGPVMVLLGDDADRLTVQRTQVPVSLSIDGGAGDDRVDAFAPALGNVFAACVWSGFESVQ